MLRRGCRLIAAAFAVLFVVYFAFFTHYFEWPGNLFAAGLGALFGGMGISGIANLLWAWRDTAAFARAARHEPPKTDASWSLPDPSVRWEPRSPAHSAPCPVLPTSTRSCRNNPGVTRLNNDVDALERAIRRGANPNARAAYGDTVLLDVRDPGMAAALIRLGADVNARDQEDGDTLLIRAARMGNVGLVSRLARSAGQFADRIDEWGDGAQRSDPWQAGRDRRASPRGRRRSLRAARRASAQHEIIAAPAAFSPLRSADNDPVPPRPRTDSIGHERTSATTPSAIWTYSRAISFSPLYLAHGRASRFCRDFALAAVVLCSAGMNLQPRVIVASPDHTENAQLSDWLAGEGLEAVPVRSLHAALQAIESHRFDVVIADSRFAEDGQLHARARTRNPGARLVVLKETGKAVAERRGDYYVDRPVEQAMLLCFVGMAMVEGRPVRRSVRKAVARFETLVEGMPAYLIDVSNDGLRLEFPAGRRSAPPPTFTVRVPLLGIALPVRRVWMTSAPGSDGTAWCGGELQQAHPRAAQNWRAFVDALPA